jgi:hypothetical protein
MAARGARAVMSLFQLFSSFGDVLVVKSLARPGGNVTGFSTLQGEIASKVLELFNDMVPGLGSGLIA